MVSIRWRRSIAAAGWPRIFGMTGALHFVSKPGQEPPFACVRLDFTDDGSLAYTNKRMIGRVGVTEDAADFIADERLGPDALDGGVDFAAFKVAVRGINAPAVPHQIGRPAYQ